MSRTLVQYIVVRADLNWPIGALIGNGCHASVAAIVKHMATDPETQEYCQQLSSMTKIVLKADNERQMLDICDHLKQNNINYYLWEEKPENIITSLATTPKQRDVLKPYFSHLKLFK